MCAPDWPQPDQGVGDHRVIVDGVPQLSIVVRADVPGGTRADGGNTTAANRLLGAIGWPQGGWILAAPKFQYINDDVGVKNLLNHFKG